ncbi:uncharacterized protein PHALS_09066 [Plasmopara halstedii]|uniref:Uncharacterized protein n=1 Tax=Plasmopara halstedii TaxID=4781 RepID=A0A0P1AEU7_PLAHL|nr:uncharacterized protein PHALS_09066 [Plasmopara halstedii]CEG39001.1 hypothetical protein PHALS_09066 [Plasmopara halstedii]|eukprot:XP_024575370.1 hypothetical protein PHALS_09066 [Plasmopara halstedii]
MGCCLSHEEDRFDGSTEALLPKGRNGVKRVEKALNGDASHKDVANGTHKSPSAVVAATDNVPAKPQPCKKPEKCELDDTPPSPLATPVINASSPTKSAPSQQPVSVSCSSSSPTSDLATVLPPKPADEDPISPKPVDEEPSPPPVPTQSLMPSKKASSKTSQLTPTETEDNIVVPAFTPMCVEAMDTHNDDDNNDDQENERDENRGENDDATGQSKESKPKKITPTKKSKKKRKKGKR